ncbi:PepSY-associated TM helix domain-containing protein [Castellaniella hirudinis]|uniref:PepSY-associated TM helix domain-containing protein n=1 Tax=Castellaniella hirudinis TaxID=1144617 RepID=UPI0039C12D1D
MKRGTARLSGPGLRQRMAGLHAWAGLLLGWVLYAMFLTGSAAYFKDELSQWMRPELSWQAQAPDPALAAQRAADAFGTSATQWALRPPSSRSQTGYAFWRAADGPRQFAEGYLDPRTGRPVMARDTMGGDFFYRFHFQFHYMPIAWGRYLAGLAAMFMLVGIISGIITHKKIFADFFTFRWGKGQRSWLDAHNGLSVLALPFHVMITYTGLVTLMALYMPWGQQAGIKTIEQRQAFSAQQSAFIAPGKASGLPAPLASVEAMVRQAQDRWGRNNIGYITVNHPGDAAARVAIARDESGRVSMSPQLLLFDGATGKLLAVRDGVGAAAEVRGVLYGLHLGRFSDNVMRWLYFLLSLAGTAMVGTGLVLWTVKRRQRMADGMRTPVGIVLVERLNLACIGGLSLAMTAYLWANRLLPVDWPARAGAEIQVFFVVWGVALVHAVLRPTRPAWREQLWAAALGLAALPLVNAWTTTRPFWSSLAQRDWVFVGADLLFWALGALHIALALGLSRRAAQRRPMPARPRCASASSKETA